MSEEKAKFSNNVDFLCSGSENDQADYIQKIIENLSLEKLVLTWIRFLTILQNPSDCGNVSVRKRNFEDSFRNETISFRRLEDFSPNAEICAISSNISVHEIERFYVVTRITSNFCKCEQSHLYVYRRLAR